MRSTAGAHIRTRNRNDADRPGQLFFTAVIQCCKGLPVRILRQNFYILQYLLVRQVFRLLNLFCRQRSRKIDRHAVLSHMEADIRIAVGMTDDTGNDMFSGMLPHMHQPSVPVNGSMHAASNLQRGAAQMENYAVLFLYICHPGAAEYTEIAGLTAALRIKGGSIQNNLPEWRIRPRCFANCQLTIHVSLRAFLQHLAAYDRRIKFCQIRIHII